MVKFLCGFPHDMAMVMATAAPVPVWHAGYFAWVLLGAVSQLAATAFLLLAMKQRNFVVDVAHCPNCGGEFGIIAAILAQPVIKMILTHLRLQARAPPRSPLGGQALQAV